MPGPAAEPTKITMLRGNPSKKRIVRESEEASGAPNCPTWLTREAKAEWKRIVPALEAIGVLKTVDRGGLAAYCQSWADYHQACRALQAEGWTELTPKGFPVKNPMVTIMNEARKALLQWSGQLGLSPAARTRLAVRSEEQRDEFEAFAAKRSG